MESTPTLRSRSRSKTPFLRCDCGEDEDHTHKSGRKTPIKSSTRFKKLNNPNQNAVPEPMETDEPALIRTRRQSAQQSEKNPNQNAVLGPIMEQDKPTLIQTRRQSARQLEKQMKTSDYSSDVSLDRLREHNKKVVQNEVNNRYEHASTSSDSHNRSILADSTLSPVAHGYGYNVTQGDRSRFDSPATQYSASSTDSSFADQALADTSVLLEKDPTPEHLPYRLYKMAGEYWNKYPKTDYTYSPLSKDRVELAPGQVAVPNMSRRSLHAFRQYGSNTGEDEVDRMAATTAWTSTTSARRRFTMESYSDDEDILHNGYRRVDHRWWITRLLITIVTSITSTMSRAYRAVAGPSHRYPYTDRRPQVSFVSRTTSAAVAPFYWIYTMIKKVVTTTVTTITETTTPIREEIERRTRFQNSRRASEKRRWWPWLLLILLPLLGYGCFNYSDQILPQQPVTAAQKSPEIMQNFDLSKRTAALENWAVNVDGKLKHIDSKVNKLENLEATFSNVNKLENLEAAFQNYYLKHMQNNVISVFNINEKGDAVTEKLKEYFNKHINDQMNVISQQIDEKLKISGKPDMDDNKIRQIIQEYLAVFEKRQMALILEQVKEYVKVVEKEVHCEETGFNAEAVKKIVAEMLKVYNADKTGLVDYAVESAGGQVLSTRCTELYQIKTKQYSIMGLPVWWVYTSPRHALTPGAMPAECWAFQGFPGYLVIRLSAVIEVTSFSMEHMSRLLAPDGKIESAPKNFSVYGLHSEDDPHPHLFGDYMYDDKGSEIQYFPVQYPKTSNIGGREYPVAYDIVELRIMSNHGNPTYTCLYRFRVHGNPLSDIRQATEDSMLD